MAESFLDLAGEGPMPAHNPLMLMKLCQRRLGRSDRDTVAIHFLSSRLGHSKEQVVLVPLFTNGVSFCGVRGVDREAAKGAGQRGWLPYTTTTSASVLAGSTKERGRPRPHSAVPPRTTIPSQHP